MKNGLTGVAAMLRLYLEMRVRWSGAIVRAGGVLSGPVSLALRLPHAHERQ